MSTGQGSGTDQTGAKKSLDEQFDWQLDHSVTPPRWVGGIAGLRSGAYRALTSTSSGSSEALDVNVVASVSGTVFDVNLIKVGGTSITLGQKAMAASIPVVLASDQSVIPVSQSGTWNISTVTTVTTVSTVTAVTSITNVVTVAGNLTNNNAAPATTNIGALVGIANAAQQTWSEGRQVLASMNLKGSMRIINQDAAGNDRGANVDATNRLSVSVDNIPAVSQSGTWNIGTVTTVTGVTTVSTVTAVTTVTNLGAGNSAAVPADDAAPSVPGITGYGMIYDPNDGNWDRARAINATLNAAAADSGIAAVGITAQFDDASIGTVTENQWANLRLSSLRALLVGGEALDDAAWTVGTMRPLAAGFFADETATDSVDEGDVGIARMTLDRRIITASENNDDTAFTVGGKVSAAGFIYDDTSPDSLDEGDVGYARVSSRREIYQQIRDAAGNERGANVDASSNLMVNLGTLIEGEDQTYHRMKTMPTYSTVYISTAATTIAKSGSGVLHTITVNGGTAGTIILYDNTAGSGTILDSFDSTNALNTYTRDIPFSTGLTIVTGGATKLSVSYL